MNESNWKKLFQSKKMVDSLTTKRVENYFDNIPSFKGDIGQSVISESRKLLSKQNPIQSARATQFDLSSDEIQAIVQRSQKGFQIIDIQPNALTRDQNFCVLPDERIIEIIGAQNEGNGAGATVDGQASTYSMVPYWRTVQLPITGNFLKIEFLPTIIQGTDTYYAPANNVQNAYYDAQNADATAQVDIAHRYAGSRVILLNFEDTTQKPILVDDGQIFKGYFTNVILTFKQLSPRIRVTVGFNTEIVTSRNNAPRNLHMWGTSGILDKNVFNPISFCITDRDVSGASSGLGIAISYGQTITKPLLQAYNNTYSGTNKYADGVSIVWISKWAFACFSQISPGSITGSASLEGELFIYDNNTSTYIKRLGTKIFEFGSDLNAGNNTLRDDSCFIEPIRVVLKPNQEIRAKFTYVNGFGAPPTPLIKFSLLGYSLGKLNGSGGTGLVTPFILDCKLTDNPYNSDLDYRFQPRT